MLKNKTYSILVILSLAFIGVVVALSFILVPRIPSINFTSLVGTKTSKVPSKPVEPKINEANGLFTVTKVVDGDTIKVDYYGKVESVRLIGLDAPEIVGTKNTCYAKEAKNFLTVFLEGKKVRLESDNKVSDRDRYNRLLRYVYLGKNNINKQLILQGYAEEVAYNVGHKYQKEFKDAQLQAFNHKLGIWSKACLLGQ